MQLIPRDTGPSPVELSLATFGSLVTGVQKAAQQWLTLFLTQVGTVKSKPDFGCSFMREISQAPLTSEDSIKEIFANASTEIFRWLDKTVPTNGVTEDDEVVATANLLNIVRVGGSLLLNVELITRAGTEAVYKVPVQVGTPASAN